MGGCDNSEGRVEVCIYGFWGTMCADTWGNTEAEVVCNQLGLSDSGNIHTHYNTYTYSKTFMQNCEMGQKFSKVTS